MKTATMLYMKSYILNVIIMNHSLITRQVILSFFIVENMSQDLQYLTYHIRLENCVTRNQIAMMPHFSVE